MDRMKAYILPGVAALVLLAYYVWSASGDPVPQPATATATATAKAPAPAAGPSAPDPAPETAPEPASDAEAKPSEPAADPTKATARARAQRDALRTRLLEAQRKRVGASQSDEPPPDQLGTLNKEYIQQRVKDDLLPLAVECYDNALADDAELGGRLVMNFRIVGEPDVGGIVEEVQMAEDSDITHPDLVECMSESMMSVSFDPPEDGGSVEVTYPFVFTTEDEGA